MSKKFIQIIAMMLITSMLAGTGMIAYAEETAQQTQTAAENDELYQEAIGFLNYLGIFYGDENGDMKPEETITRAEISAIILREMNVTSKATYNNIFTDVDSSHWAADDIQTAYESGIIAGYGNGTFGPDDDVTYEQAVKMIVCAINWGSYAAAYGEYPIGYLHIADEQDIMDNATGKVGEPVTRRTVAKLVYNSLTAEYPVVTGATSNLLDYETKEGVTILSEKRDIYFKEGMITASAGKSLGASNALRENQIALEDEIMYSEVQNADEYVAEYSRVFYRDVDGNGNEKTAVYVIPMTSKTNSVTLDAGDISEIVTGYVGGTPQIKYYENNRIRDIDLVNQPVVLYNNQTFTMANFSKLDLDGETFDEFITPEQGSVKAVDFNKDGDYDALFVESYVTSVIKTATAKRIQLEYPISGEYMLDLDTSDNDNLTVNVYRDGDKCELRDLSAGDVISVKMNANFSDSTYTGDKYITIEASVDYFDGVVKGVSASEGKGRYVTIDDTKYEVINNEDLIADLRAAMGSKVKVYLDQFGSVAFVEGVAGGGLASGEKYAWLMSLYEDESGDDVIAELYTSDGERKEFELKSTVDYWAPNATENTQTSALEIAEAINGNGNYFLTATTADTGETVSIRLCKFKTNSAGQITRLYIAVDEKAVDENSSAVKVSTVDHQESHLRSGLFAGRYYIENGVAQLTVPLSEADVRDAENYEYRYASTSEFSSTSGEDGLGYVCFLGDVSDAAPGIMIKMVQSSDEPQSVEEYGTADDNPVILISEIDMAVNEDDEEIYVIEGYRDGELVEYTTSRNVTVAQVAPEVWVGNNKTYSANTIWTMDYEEKLTDVLHPGDICGMAGSASNIGVILRMVDTEGLADHLAGGGVAGTVPEGQFFRDEMFSPTRDRIIFGCVTDMRTSPIIQLDLNVSGYNGEDLETELVTVGIADIERAVQFVYISKNGKITVEEEISDSYEIEAGDYIFMRNFKNDASRELFVIRYE